MTETEKGRDLPVPDLAKIKSNKDKYFFFHVITLKEHFFRGATNDHDRKTLVPKITGKFTKLPYYFRPKKNFFTN